MKRNKLIVLCLFFGFFSCVPARKFEEVKDKKEICEEQRSALQEQVRVLEENMTETSERLEELEKRNTALKMDTAIIGKSLRLMTHNYDKLNETYQLLLDKNRELLAGNQTQTEKLFNNLEKSQRELQKQQDALRELQKSLNEKEENLAVLNKELDLRAQRVEELEKILQSKDSAVHALKNKVQDALLGFEDKGLSIKQKNGKVYVSLEESLLFSSGSYNVDPKGVTVLKKLGSVLEKNSDINILVEGHTDNVPYNGSGQLKDNWDLSVKRATSVVKILLENSSIDPSRLTAAGRGEHVPLASNQTKEGRSKNRRTEIILTPKLDELLEILGTN